MKGVTEKEMWFIDYGTRIRLWYIDYGTGYGNEWAYGSLDDAVMAADDGAVYTQCDIMIRSENMEPIGVRRWIGRSFNPNTDPDTNPIEFGAFGYHTDWEMILDIYHAFNSDLFELIPKEEFDDIDILASSKQDAREKLAKYFANLGAKTELSNTSEEVIVTLQNGNELVYFGFDVD